MRMTPGWELRTTGTPELPPIEPKLKTWFDPVLVKLTDTGVGDIGATLVAGWDWATRGVFVMVMAELPTLIGNWLFRARSRRTS